MRKYWIFLIVSLVLIFGTFIATLASGNAPVLGLDLQGGVSVVKSPVGKYTNDSLDVAVDVIRNRVDSLGTLEPEITRQGSDIVIDLPGVKNRDRAIKLVGETGELRFRPVLLAPGAVPPKPGAAVPPSTSSTTAPTSTTAAPTPEATAAELAAAQQAVASCDANAVAALPSAPTTTRGKDTRDACVILPDKDSPKVRYYLGPAGLTGKVVASAKAEFISSEGWTVKMDLTDDGSAQWDQLAQQQFHQQVAIVLDGEVRSAPTIQPNDAAFTSFGGTAVISGGAGGFSSGDAQDLAKLINYGALPVRLKTVNVEDVSPTLGEDQLRAGIIAGLIGLALVAIYMLVFYRLLGLVVIFGLILSGMTLYTLVTYLGSSVNLTLTLAGVTGIIVSAGVTVDSYIVYFERLKDEVRAGATVRACADRAFHRSFRTILAADLVSLIGAGVLYLLAIGSVRGFAFFLGLSTIVDLVLSYFVMYPLVVLMSRRPELVRMKGIGMAAGLDAPGVMA
ncbi:MAG TPA: protein translocase subunit SecD [Acidimicrobiia bacterium]|nr:protein translocase subunit SecD [Acidimicrobiia bacterium]